VQKLRSKSDFKNSGSTRSHKGQLDRTGHDGPPALQPEISLYWLGCRVSRERGDEFSAYGVSKERAVWERESVRHLPAAADARKIARRELDSGNQ